MNDLVRHKVEIKQAPPDTGISFWSLVLNFLPVILIIGFWLFMMRQMQQGGSKGAMSFGRSRAKLQGEDQVKVTFADVAGCDEAKEEVAELVEFLRDPGKFQKLGGKIPRGVLMVGPPGTGKTLLAKAIAGEAKVPFFSISGSDFVEMFVGVGASRVRDMFEQAKKHAPCIIFIDEIDAVGRHRGAGLGGGHDEREQTLNQLLVEMDGFEGGEGVIVDRRDQPPRRARSGAAASGPFRPPGRGRPARRARPRADPARAHAQGAAGRRRRCRWSIARGTPGFSGADLANLVNEAALFAARENGREVRMEHFDRARDKIMMGAERRSMAMSERGKDAHRLSRGRPRHRRPPRARARSGLQGHDHSARPCARRDHVPAGRRQVQLQPHRDRIAAVLAVRRPRRRGTDLRRRQGHHRRLQRHRARHQDGAQHGHQVGPVRRARPDRLWRGRGRGVPRPLGHAAQERLRRHRAQDRRSRAQHPRQGLWRAPRRS